MSQQQQYPSAGGYPSALPVQPPNPQYPHQLPRWSTGLCSCGADCSSSCMTLWCPCVTLGRVAEIIDQGGTSCCRHAIVYSLLAMMGVGCLYSCQYRKKLRVQFGLPTEPCGDCCVHWCCNFCALAQEHRELQNRGFKPSAGWVSASVSPPVPHPGMQR